MMVEQGALAEGTAMDADYEVGVEKREGRGGGRGTRQWRRTWALKRGALPIHDAQGAAELRRPPTPYTSRRDAFVRLVGRSARWSA